MYWARRPASLLTTRGCHTVGDSGNRTTRRNRPVASEPSSSVHFLPFDQYNALQSPMEKSSGRAGGGSLGPVSMPGASLPGEPAERSYWNDTNVAMSRALNDVSSSRA